MALYITLDLTHYGKVGVWTRIDGQATSIRQPISENTTSQALRALAAQFAKKESE